MGYTEYFKAGLTFALNQKPVQDAIKWREDRKYTPIGMSMRKIYSQKHKRDFIRINFDFYLQNQNQNLAEDVVVWLKWDKEKYILHSVNSALEVDGVE